MKTEILSYKKIGSTVFDHEPGRGKGFLQTIFQMHNAFLLPAAFLLGRASLVAGLMPFGLSIYAATIGLEVNRLLIAAFIVLGMATGGAREQLYVTIAAMMLFSAFNIPFKNNSRLNFRHAVLGFLSVLIPEAVSAYMQGLLLFDILRALFHGFIVFALIFVFKHVAPILEGGRKKIVLSNEEMISVAIFGALVLSGFGNFQFIGFSIKNVLCIILILVFSYKCGPGVGAAIGVTVGLIVSMSNPLTPIVISSYAFCGLLSGVLKSLGKVGSSLGFVMGNTILTIYLNGSVEVLIYLKEIVLAVIVFILIPQKLIEKLTDSFMANTGANTDKRGYSTRLKEITVERLNKFSHAFRELSKTFKEISETKVTTDKQDISSLFDRVADKVCKDCSLCLHCWDRNFYNTYQVMFKIVERLEAKGRVEESDIPGYFLDKCERINEFIKAINNVYEIFKVDMIWKQKIGESRELVSQQLGGLSNVISGLASEINMEVSFIGELEDSVTLELLRLDIRVSEVVAFENKWGKYELSVRYKECAENRNSVGIIEKIVSEQVGRKMKKEESECSQNLKDGSCSLKLVEEEALKVTTGVAKVAKNNGTISGDTYTFFNTGDGRYVVALSDGMGSGQKAAIQSRAVISLLEQFMESGFDKDTSVKLINSILVLKSSEDSFATIDLSVIDLFSGEVEFVKVGALSTYIKKEERVETVRSSSLPAGILCNFETELIHKKVNSGDFIIMTTDGIVDSFKGSDDGEKELLKLIQDINSINPQEIADTILDKAYENCSGKPEDDMMVLVAKVWKHF